MRRVCNDCRHIGGRAFDGHRWSLDCTVDREPGEWRLAHRIHADPDEHVCEHFSAALLDDLRHAEELAVLERCGAHVPSLAQALAQWRQGPPNDVDVAPFQGPHFMVTESGRDASPAFAAIRGHLADVIGGKEKPRTVFWISPHARAGVRVHELSNTLLVEVGPAASRASVLVAFLTAFLPRHPDAKPSWLGRYLEEYGVDRSDPIFDRIAAEEDASG